MTIEKQPTFVVHCELNEAVRLPKRCKKSIQVMQNQKAACD